MAATDQMSETHSDVIYEKENTGHQPKLPEFDDNETFIPENFDNIGKNSVERAKEIDLPTIKVDSISPFNSPRVASPVIVPTRLNFDDPKV